MRTKKDIKFLLENGLSTSFVSKLNEVQTKSLVKRFNKKETNEITMVSSADSATQSKLQSEKKPYEVYEKTEMDEDSTFNIVKDPDATEDGMPTTEGEMRERFESQSQQNFFWAKCNTSNGVKKKKWCELAREFSDSTSKKQYKTMPKKKNPEKMDESSEKFLEDRIVEMIERHIDPKMTKGDILKTISEKMEKNNSMMLKNPKKMSMFSHESGIESKKMKRPTQMMPVMGTMEENETKEKERTKEKEAPTKPGTPPKRRENPFKNPNPGVKEDPRGQKKNKEKMKQDFIELINQAF
jgi:hypothetical protein